MANNLKKSKENGKIIQYPKILFFDTPTTLQWNIGNNEVILYEEKIKLNNSKLINVDSTIAAEITSADSFTGINTFNTYRLYINERLVSVAGYETDVDIVLGPNLETSSLIWGGKVIPNNTTQNYFKKNKKSKKYVNIKVTAQLKTSLGSLVTSNVDNSIGRFIGAKGAFLRVTIL